MNLFLTYQSDIFSYLNQVQILNNLEQSNKWVNICKLIIFQFNFFLEDLIRI